MDKLCCTNSFSDEAIKKFIMDENILGACHYCKSKDVYICDIIDIRSFIKEGIGRHYENAVENVIYEEGEFDLPTLNIEEILLYEQAIFGELLDDPTILLDDLKFDNSICYVKHEPYGPIPGRPDEIEYWENYCKIVKSQQRFTILQPQSGFDQYEKSKPSNFLSDIAKTYVPSLIRNLCVGDIIYRARIQKGNKEFGHTDLTSPKAEVSKNNRMSPTGISFFYGCMDSMTCIHEVRPEIGEIVDVAKFEVLKDLFVLDLTEEIQFQKSIFCSNYSYYSEEVFKPFLKHFVNEISKPIRKTDNEIEYIPTQVFAEF